MWTFWHSKEATKREKEKVGKSYLEHRSETEDRIELIKIIRRDVGLGMMDTTRLLTMWLDDQLKHENNSKE